MTTQLRRVIDEALRTGDRRLAHEIARESRRAGLWPPPINGHRLWSELDTEIFYAFVAIGMPRTSMWPHSDEWRPRIVRHPHIGWTIEELRGIQAASAYLIQKSSINESWPNPGGLLASEYLRLSDRALGEIDDPLSDSEWALLRDWSMALQRPEVWGPVAYSATQVTIDALLELF